MSEQLASTPIQEKQPVFRKNLVQRVLVGLLLIALVPILIISAVTFIRTRNTVQSQALSQLSSLADSYSVQIQQFVATRRQALDQINQSAGFDTNVAVLFQGKSASTYYFALASLTNYINQYIETPTEKIFDQVSIVDTDGTVLVSSNPNLTGTILSDSYTIRSMYQLNKSVLAYDPGGLFPGQLVLISSKIYINPQGAPGLTLIGFSTSPIPLSQLNTSQSFFESSAGYILATDNTFISTDEETVAPIVVPLTSDELGVIQSRITTGGLGSQYQYNDLNGTQVFGYYKNLPVVSSNLIIEVPQSVVLGQIEDLLPFTLILLTALMLISALIVYLSSRRIVKPLVDLANDAQTFSAGDWSYRAKVDRDDEIGLLAYSFNNMVDQLTGYYYSLEEKVDSRTQQLRLAAEIAQEASKGFTQGDVLRQASVAITEKLEIPYHAIYLIDSVSKTASLLEQNSTLTDPLPEKNSVITINNESMVGWSALNKRPRTSGDIRSEKEFTNSQGVLSSTASQITIPITLEDDVVAILDFQSNLPNIFDNESLTVYSSLSDQLATGLRNIQAVETATVGLRETNALYTTSRQVTVANSIEEVTEHLAFLFNQTQYVSFFFSIIGEQIHLINVTDPKGTRLDQSLKGFNIPLGKGLSRLTGNAMLILDDLKSESDFSNLNAYFERRGCTSVALLPIRITNDLGYLLVMGSRDPEPLSILQIQPYINLTEVVGATLERVTLLSTLNQRVKELDTLSSISQSATTATNIEDLFERVHQELIQTLGFELGFSVILNNIEEETLSIAYYKEDEKLTIPTYPYTDDLVSLLITKGEPILHRDASVLGLRSIDFDQYTLTAKSWLGIPLILADRVLGGLVLFDSETSNRFSDVDRELLSTLAPQIAASIQNTELIAAQERALDAFEGERFLLNSLLKNIPDEIIFKNAKGEFIRLSDSASRSLGVESPESLVGKMDANDEITETETGFELDVDSDLSVISRATPVLGKIEQVDSISGNKGWAFTSKIPLLDEAGDVSALLKISRDVTELINTQNIARRRADQLLTTSEIAREATTGNLDIDETLTRLVDLVKTRFGFYHSSIFLLDVLGQFAVLRESTGEAGAQLKEKGHKLAVGSASIIGQTTSSGEPVVVGDVTKELNYYPNPLLPNTHSEMGIPLKIGDKVYGALDVQSEKVDAFTQEDINILRVLADQLTVTIQNANLYTKTQQTLERHRLLQQLTSSAGQNITVEDATRNAVQALQRIFPQEKVTYMISSSPERLKVNSYAGYSHESLLVEEITKGQGLIGKAGSENKAQLSIDIPSTDEGNALCEGTRSVIAVPVAYANRLMGVFVIESLEPGMFDENDQDIVSTLSSNMASLIANIELVEQIRLQVDRQRQLYDITSKIRRSTDVETIMKTSLAEICTALNIRKASIELLQKESEIDTVSDAMKSQKGN